MDLYIEVTFSNIRGAPKTSMMGVLVGVIGDGKIRGQKSLKLADNRLFYGTWVRRSMDQHSGKETSQHQFES